ncbi:MAG: pyrimidine-nucleoside phosphorylase, partial [Firmicutes bacterium]|nr:pyrimidine-nucleoside phosphorylase [Bacillota bacterium]
VSLLLGAGRSTKEDVIDNTAGYILAKKTGDMALKGDLIATLYTTDKPEALEQAAELMLSATGFWKQAPEQMPLILDVIE